MVGNTYAIYIRYGLLAYLACASASLAGQVLGEKEAENAPKTKPKQNCGVTYAKAGDNTSLKSGNYLNQVVKPTCDAFLAKQANRNDWKCVYLNQDILGDQVAENLSRIGIFKMLNHTAMQNDQSLVGQDISDGRGVVFAFNIREFWHDKAESHWQTVASAQGRRLSIDLQRPNQKSNVPSLKPFNANEPVAADQLVYNLSFPYIYHELIDHPSNRSSLLGLDELGLQRDGGQYKALGFGAVPDSQKNETTGREEGSITESARVFYVYETSDKRLLWDATDDFDGQEKAVPFQPGSNDVPNYRSGNYGDTYMVQIGNASLHANETRLEMKNGCFSNYIWGNAGQERLLAELTFVQDYLNPDAEEFLLNGRSCITCHQQGVWKKLGVFAKQVQENPNQFSQQGRAAWLNQKQLTDLYERSATRWIEGCMKPVVCQLSNADENMNEDIIQGVFLMPGSEPDLDPYNPQQRRKVYEANAEPTMFLIRHWEQANPPG